MFKELTFKQWKRHYVTMFKYNLKRKIKRANLLEREINASMDVLKTIEEATNFNPVLVKLITKEIYNIFEDANG